MKQYLGWIPPNAHKVLEFGCGSGDWGRIFKEVQPECIYVGVEGDQAAVKLARQRLDIVIDSRDAAHLAEVIFALAPFDCVIYHQAGLKNEFGMDVPLAPNGQVLLFAADSDENFPWRISNHEQRKNWDMVTLFSDPVCAFMRMIIPNSFYKTSPSVNITEMKLGNLLDPNSLPQGNPYVLIYQRFYSGSLAIAKSIYERLTSYGGVLIHEFDDWPEKWRDKYIGTKYYEFVGAHVVQTTTESLGEYFRQFNPYVLVFPNELCNLPPMRKKCVLTDKVYIFYGAVNRQEEWQRILPVIIEAIKIYGDKIYFNIVAERDFFEALPTRNKKYYGEDINGGRFVPYEIYEEVLHASDVALLPLLDTEFNRRKSDLKFIEAAAHGAVALASPTVYGNTIKDGETGFIYNNLREFRKKLFLLIENKPLREELAAGAYSYVKKNRLMCQHYEERLAVYKELLDRRPDLERERQARIAKLEEGRDSIAGL